MLSFILGTMFGGIVGVAVMCLVQINRPEWDKEE